MQIGDNEFQFLIEGENFNDLLTKEKKEKHYMQKKLEKEKRKIKEHKNKDKYYYNKRATKSYDKNYYKKKEQYYKNEKSDNNNIKGLNMIIIIIGKLEIIKIIFLMIILKIMD